MHPEPIGNKLKYQKTIECLIEKSHPLTERQQSIVCVNWTGFRQYLKRKIC